MSFNERVIAEIRRIPRGKVATYGQIAGLAGSPRGAIIVGRILAAQTTREQLPWQRVINSKGRISIINMEHPAEEQAMLLEAEGIKIENHDGAFWVDLRQYLWQPSPMS